MPSIKRTGLKAQEHKTGFESYDGPEITKRGIYRARINSIKVKTFKSGSQGYAIGLVLEAQSGDPKDHAKFDGYSLFTNLVWGDKEQMIQREENFYLALGLKGSDPAVVHDDGDLDAGGQGAKIKTIGGKNPVGAIVNADIKMGTYEGEARPEVDSILRFVEKAVSKAVAEDVDDEDEDLMEDEVEIEEEGEEGEDEDQTLEERRDELNGSKIAELRELATSDYDLEVAGLKKAEIIEVILEHEFSDEEDTPMVNEDDESEEDDEPEVEEDEEEPEEPEDDEEEEEDDSDRDARVAELAGLDRRALKVILAEVSPDTKVYKSTTDEAIRETILETEFPEDETPF